jgi:hypothetical protein
LLYSGVTNPLDIYEPLSYKQAELAYGKYKDVKFNNKKERASAYVFHKKIEKLY